MRRVVLEVRRFEQLCVFALVLNVLSARLCSRCIVQYIYPEMSRLRTVFFPRPTL